MQPGAMLSQKPKVPTEVAKKLLQADLGVLVDSLGSFLSGPPTLAMLGTALSKLGGGARNSPKQPDPNHPKHPTGASAQFRTPPSR